MKSINELLEKIIKEKNLIYFVVSNRRKKDLEEFDKITIRPILLKSEFIYQITYNYKNKVTHENLKDHEMIEKVMGFFETNFKQGQIYTSGADYQILVSKKFKVNILKKAPSKKAVNLEHNRKKNYIIPEDQPCAFLSRLGVMNEKGKVFASKYDKFRQINRFLEMIADVAIHFEQHKKINIIDFGCGKSYLTFAMYHYFVDILKMDVNIIGLDLKKDVVKHCNLIAKDLGYKDLQFKIGDIEHFEGLKKVDMVVTLHACDTATDAALAKSIEWNADVILSVPCCQHELFEQVHNEVMVPLEKHGIIKERMSALITDSIRANILEIMGYKTQIIEFIDLEHTPKNLLIRAIKTGKAASGVIYEYNEFKSFWNVSPYLEKALGEGFQSKLAKGRNTNE